MHSVLLLAGLVFVVCGLPAIGVRLLVRTWRDQDSCYEQGGVYSRLFPESARHGYDAGFPLGVSLWSPGLAIVVILAGPEIMGLSFELPQVVGHVLGRLAQVLFFGGAALGFWLMLFMFPKFLVPPHLRGQRGWIAESRHQMRLRRAQRRGRNARR